ncbi:hypothetical protein HNP46_004260 [Pseudomonas nitritireducens]|uniref:Dual specificity protein phosphatase family protein n=1 Tax=Pseudomonas nitroreducens TaxID=46680 RepID=A0A7W7KM78_PSENT|nr:hypothetical protein [Pseudomonas nitritireducens]MBB4865379.1 hypothetical protein [Pseudomonas nitritireducens]
MKFVTEKHGNNPDKGNFDADFPRIAFLNATCGWTAMQPQSPHRNLLMVMADDLVRKTIFHGLTGLLERNDMLSFQGKKWAWENSTKTGFRSAPMCLADGRRIIEFYLEHKQRGTKVLTVSCEYGKSRSVTTANFLQAVDQGLSPPADTDAPNEHISRQLRMAWDEHLKRQSRV